MKVAIIGAGITGIVLAHKLVQKGLDVTLFEKDASVGGLASSFSVGQTHLEKYFHHIFLGDSHMRDLIEDANLTNDLDWRVAPMGIYCDSHLFQFGTPLDLLRFTSLGFWDRVRLGFSFLGAKKNQEQLVLDGQSAKQWIENTCGENVYNRFWHPLLTAKFGQAAPEISAAWLWGRLHARARSRTHGKERLGYLRGGFYQVFEQLLKQIKSQSGHLLLDTLVSQIVPTDHGRWRVTTNIGESSYDRIVFTTPCPHISKCIPQMPSHELIAFNNIRYQAVVCMTLVLNRSISPVYWLNIVDPSLAFTGVIEHTQLVPTQDYDGKHIVYLFNYLKPDHPWLNNSTEELLNRYCDSLKCIFPSFSKEQIRDVYCFKNMHATPIYDVGFSKKQPPLASTLPGLFFANTSHIYPQDRNMNFSVELAKRLAALVLNSRH